MSQPVQPTQHQRQRQHQQADQASRPSSSLRPCKTLPDRVPSAAAREMRPAALNINRRRRTGSVIAPFAGRLGGNQEFVVDRSNPENAELLMKVPDAAPNLNLDETFDLRGFREVDLYKAALIEFVGTLIFVYASAWNSLSSATRPPNPSPTSGVYSTTPFLAPLVASCINAILLSLLIFCFGAISGGHMNPLITIGTFFGRLTTFPRLVLYLAAQISGGALAGLLVRASAGTRDFKVGGCYLFEDQAKVSSAFTIEVVGDLLLLVLAFGVGLDPRQREIFGPALGPIFVGLAAASVGLCTAFSLPGFGGAGLNAARCFGVFVGSRFPGWHWVHWVAPIIASMFNGVVYFLVPPVAPKGRVAPRPTNQPSTHREDEEEEEEKKKEEEGSAIV